MEHRVLSILVFLVSALAVNGQSTTGPTVITTNIVGTASVLEGRSIHVSCVVKNMQQWTFLTWQKQTAKGPLKIATNVQLESAYAGLQNRYKFSMGGAPNPQTNTLEFNLDISVTKFEDSGNYSCVSTTATAYFGIIVVGDPDTPTVSIVDHSQGGAVLTIENGDTLTVTKGATYDIQYLVTGASPAAVVNITSGPWYRQSGTPQYTVTPNIVHTVYPGYDAVTYNVLKLHPNVQFDFFISPRPVICAAYVSAVNYTGKVYTMTFNVQFAEFAPVVNCTPTVYASINQPQAYLTCTVIAPVTSKPDFWFSFNSNGHNVSLHVADSQQKSPDGTFTADATFANDVYTMRLLVSKVQQWSFGQYNFTASNSIGSSSAYTSLLQAVPTSPASGAGGAGAASGKGGVARIEIPMATILVLAISLVFFRP